MTENVVYFFGCGTHRDPRMMSFIIGRSATKIKGTPAKLLGYNLRLQELKHVPDIDLFKDDMVHTSVRTILKKNWGKSFKNYVIKKDPESFVVGMIWEITPDELDILKYWELVDFGWYEDCGGIAISEKGEKVAVVTVRLRKGQEAGQVVGADQYKVWLQHPDLYKKIAKESREYFIKQKHGNQ